MDIIKLSKKVANKVNFIYTQVSAEVNALIERITHSKQFIQKIDQTKSFPQEPRRISVAITHYERPEILAVALKNIFKDERVSEIVILDDGSSLSSVSYCIKNLKDFKVKVKFFRRAENLGPFATKIQACSLCSNAWCILLDSDNTIFDSYLDAIFSLETWDQETIYCPGFAFPNFDFRVYGDSLFDFNDICNLQKTTDASRFNPFINDCNYFLNVKEFTEVLEPYIKIKPQAADTILLNYLWLSDGKKLRVLPNASYYHRVHPKSNWILSPDTHAGFYKLISKFEKEERATLENLLLLDFENLSKTDQKIEHIPLDI